MELKPILKEFQDKVSDKITLKEKGINRYLIRNPFIFEDGDNLVIILKYDEKQKLWYLTDEGETYQHLSYFMDSKDFMKGTRKDIIENSKKMFGIQEVKGELKLLISNQDYGNALYNFVQCVLRISERDK